LLLKPLTAAFSTENCWRNLPLALRWFGGFEYAMSILFPCAELRNLKRRYESALRMWGQLEFPVHNEPVGSRAQQLDRLHLKLRALEARNDAAERVLAHQEKCRLCKIEVEFVNGPGRLKVRRNRPLGPIDTKTASRTLTPKTPEKVKRREHRAVGTVPRRLIGNYQLGKSRSCQHSNTAIASPASKTMAQNKHRAQPK
jgi:hypothetical protein